MSEIKVRCNACGAINRLLVEQFGQAICGSCKQSFSALPVVLPQYLAKHLEATPILVIAVMHDLLVRSERHAWLPDFMEYLATLKPLADAYAHIVDIIFVPLGVEELELSGPGSDPGFIQRLDVRWVPTLIMFDIDRSILWRDFNTPWQRVQYAITSMCQVDPVFDLSQPSYNDYADELPSVKEQRVSSEELLQKIERFDILEEQAGIRIDGLWANLDDRLLKITGEVATLDGREFRATVVLELAAYDQANRVICKGSAYISETKLRNFAPFETLLSLPIAWDQISRIRMYPE